MEQLRAAELKRFLRKNKIQAKDIVIILDNLDYAKNVAQIFRIADAMGVKTVYLTGSTHRPPFGKALKKVSRSKENKVIWKYYDNSHKIIDSLRKRGYKIVALEITDTAKNVYSSSFNSPIALVLGSETHGVAPKTLNKCDYSIFIPMLGKGASLNVSVATGIALSHILRSE